MKCHFFFPALISEVGCLDRWEHKHFQALHKRSHFRKQLMAHAMVSKNNSGRKKHWYIPERFLQVIMSSNYTWNLKVCINFQFWDVVPMRVTLTIEVTLAATSAHGTNLWPGQTHLMRCCYLPGPLEYIQRLQHQGLLVWRANKQIIHIWHMKKICLS